MDIEFRNVKLLIVLFLVLILTMASACGQPASDSSDKPTVAVSIVPQSTFVKEVAGELVDVVTMIPLEAVLRPTQLLPIN